MVYEFQQVTLSHRGAGEEVVIVRDFSLLVDDGEMLALTGPSGSGKTTLLNAMAGFLRPTDGCVLYRGTDLGQMTREESSRYRNRSIGMVHQFFNLLPDMNAVHNVMLPLLIRGESRSHARAEAYEILDRLGISSRAKHRPAQLSGGEQQRVAIARALVTGPKVLLADEPTGNLDQTSTAEFLSLLRGLHDSAGLTTVLVTHDSAVAAISTRRVDMGMPEESLAHG